MSRSVAVDLTCRAVGRVQAWSQLHIDDEVLAAGLFRPNAPGRHELTTLRGLQARQLLKARGAYVSERVVIAVTVLDLYVISPVFGLRWCGELRRYPRREVEVTQVGRAAGTETAAISIRHRTGAPIAELVGHGHESGADGVLRVLGIGA